MIKRILMIAYHYPPLQGSSGIQRTLRFSRYLSEFGWEPIILTVHPRAYPNTSDDQLGEISDQMKIYRAFALDTSKHLSCMRRYPHILALPDRWVSWWLGAVPLGLSLIKKYKPHVIWSTYPIATAHLIGLTLNRITDVPWVADFRDPMVEADYPPNPLTHRAYQWVEKKTITHCSRAIFTTQGTSNNYKKKYPEISKSRFSVIENGYDEENFVIAEKVAGCIQPRNNQFVLLHSGIVYPSERDPIPFFKALSDLFKQNLISPENLKVIFRASLNESYLNQLINQYGIKTIVSLAPPIPYQDALTEMLGADGLLILQASNCNSQIPAKLYEYLRARRPILALTDSNGDTAIKLKIFGIDTIAPLDSTNEIKQALLHFLSLAKQNNAQIAPMDEVKNNSRKSRTRDFSNLLNAIIDQP